MSANVSTLPPMHVGSTSWFARHEIQLASRDFMRMMTAGNPRRRPLIFCFFVLAVVFFHFLSWSMLQPALEADIKPDLKTMTIVTGSIILTFSLMMSQALEMVTRAFYARSDLDLILSSPVSIKKHFIVRVGTIAVSTTLLSLTLFAPALNVLAVLDSPYWLAGYPMFFAVGALVTALSLTITVGLFKIVGAKKTRLIAQIIAAVVGAAFIIGIQIAAISSLGTVSRVSFLNSDMVLKIVPSIDNFVWFPAKAMLGNLSEFVICMALAVTSIVVAVAVFSDKFGEKVLAASNFSGGAAKQSSARSVFKQRSVSSHLRQKEWKLLLRDHWLISQSLMQILYLLPPAFMLWKGFGEAGALDVVVVPILVMATGQLAGGLAWLAISGEDAPDLVATAPVPPNSITRAKIEAVLGAIALVTCPIIVVLAFLNPVLAIVCMGMIGVSATSATMIQLWFRSQAKRSNFRRRQTSSKIATVTEAFSSILWAGTAGLVAVGSPFAIVSTILAIGVLAAARSFRPI